MSGKTHFAVTDIALVGVFCALWVVLNLTLGPLSFRLLGGVPVLHDFAVFFTLLLATWATGKYGASSLVGIMGSAVTMLLTPTPLPMIGFAASAVLFDVLMSVNHHKFHNTKYNLAVAAFATVLSAYFAGVVIGSFFMTNTLQWALTVWGGLHLIGGIITVAITLPIIASLEKANVRKVKRE